MARLSPPDFDEIEIDTGVNEKPAKGKSKAKNQSKSLRLPKSYSLTEDNHKYLMTEAMRLSLETGERHTASSFLDDIVSIYRGKKV